MADLNAAIDNGWYMTTPSTLNLPAGVAYGYVRVERPSDTHVHQWAYNYGTLVVTEYHRYFNGSVWSAWALPPPNGSDLVWTNLPLGGVASHYAAPYGPAQYRKLGNGMVVCQGLIITSGLGNVCTFPVGYRPTAGRLLIFQASNSTAPPPPEVFRLDGSTGVLTVQAAFGWASTADISWYADS